jgi:hypothetical protein
MLPTPSLQPVDQPPSLTLASITPFGSSPKISLNLAIHSAPLLKAALLSLKSARLKGHAVWGADSDDAQNFTECLGSISQVQTIFRRVLDAPCVLSVLG